MGVMISVTIANKMTLAYLGLFAQNSIWPPSGKMIVKL